MGTSSHASPRVSDLWDVSREKWRARVPPRAVVIALGAQPRGVLFLPQL